MQSCPVEFSHPTEAQQLSGLGPTLCRRLTERLRDYNDEHGLPMPQLPHKGNKRLALKDTNGVLMQTRSQASQYQCE